MKNSSQSFVLWFTGLSGSGKSTLCKRIALYLEERCIPIEVLDGDQIRSVFPNTGFDRESRIAHLKWAGLLASYLEKHGVVVLGSFISPYQESREFIRSKCERFIEVYLSTPLDQCEQRDVKGLYEKARAGHIKAFTGIDSPFEPPLNPEIIIDTSVMSVEQSSEMIISYLEPLLNKQQRR